MAQLAGERHSDIIYGDITQLSQICPMDCIQIATQFGSLEVYDISNDTHYIPGELLLTFQKYIKVTSTYWSYAELSLLAEVGGYVGLFLGVSVNQISDIFEIILMFRMDQISEVVMGSIMGGLDYLAKFLAGLKSMFYLIKVQILGWLKPTKPTR